MNWFVQMGGVAPTPIEATWSTTFGTVYAPAGEAGRLVEFRSLRADRKARGMKLWVRDPNASGFTDEARRQTDLLRGAEEEQDTLDFIEAVMDTDGWK